MISRRELLDILEDMKDEKNNAVISEYVDLVSFLDDKSLEQILRQRGIETKDDAMEFIKTKTTRELHKFKPLNELISFGTNGRTLHIHVIPTSFQHMLSPRGIRKAELQLIDALEKIREILSTDENYKHINNVFAVSNLITRPITGIFEKLGFDVKSMLTVQAPNDPELSKFYEMFKNGKKLGRATISKEKMLSEEWDKCITARKEELQKKLGNGFLESIEAQVNTEVSEEEINLANKSHARDIITIGTGEIK